MDKEKSLNELINGRIIDTIYIPNDLQAEYDLDKILNSPRILSADHDKNIKETNERESQIEELRRRIKESSEKLTLRSLSTETKFASNKKQDEKIKELELTESDIVPVEARAELFNFLEALVSVEKDGEVTYVFDKPEKYWIDYLKELFDNRPQSYLRVLNLMMSITITDESEKAILDDIDFLS